MLSFALGLLALEIVDGLARPRRRRELRSFGLRVLLVLCGFGGALALVGNTQVAALFTIAGAAAITVGSNLKHRVLGEPVLFSDLVAARSFVRHPRFYIDAIPASVRFAGPVVAGAVVVAVAAGFVPYSAPHLAGLALSTGAATALVAFVYAPCGRAFMQRPNHADDVARHGLLLTLVVYWLRWRAQPDTPQRVALRPAPTADLVIVVQCESFCDPAELVQATASLPGLARARRLAWQWGSLKVSGFGAYTMRTEHAVLFGGDEAELGFRRYDPFLTAHRETAEALPATLAREGYRTVFVHPHDLRFYNRRHLMPKFGFQRVVGHEAFEPAEPSSGPYVSDRALGAKLQRLVAHATEPTLIYAVTMENHGPWRADRLPGVGGALDAYMHHLRHGDALLNSMIDTLLEDGRSAVLAFFGDHRPFIPGVVGPGGGRDTPYVLLRFGGANPRQDRSAARVDLTPSQLHDAIVVCYSVGSASEPSHDPGAAGRANATAL